MARAVVGARRGDGPDGLGFLSLKYTKVMSLGGAFRSQSVHYLVIVSVGSQHSGYFGRLLDKDNTR